MKGFGDQMLQKENRHKGVLAAAAAGSDFDSVRLSGRRRGVF